MNKKLFFSTLLLVPILVCSQELDEEYLNSLPKDIRDDLIARTEAKKDLEKPIYRRASTSLDKKEEGSDIQKVTELFGSSFFDTIQSSFMPINEPNLDSSYVLDFGDVLKIQLIGQKNSSESYAIGRDGSINVSDIGKISLSGLSLENASSLIKARIKNDFIGTEAFVSLENIRDITVLIAGNAFNPGIYTLNGNSNMLHAISIAGGINDIGSYRSIDLIRNGEIIRSLDVYELLISGIYNFSSGLRSGDSIVVNPIGSIVAVESGLVRPALYELNENESFQDIIKFANGLSRNADLNNIIVKRVLRGESFIYNLEYKDLLSFKFEDNDSIFIREYKIDNVNITGAVKNPGSYKLTKGTTLSSLIKIAGGYDQSAYPFGGYLENKSALKINQESKQRLYDTFINNLVMNSSSSVADESVVSLIRQLKDADVTGRVIAEFDLDMLKNNEDLDTILEDGDRIFIPNITQQVYIQGEISNPGAIRYSPGKDIEYYINNSGGSLKSADLKNIFIVHPNGETKNFSNNNRLSFLLAENDIDLIYPGSIIYVPQTTDFADSLQVASIWAPIISSIALSLTSLSVLNNSN